MNTVNRDEQKVRLKIAIDKEHAPQGDTVALAMVVVPQEKETRLPFPTSQRFDFVVLHDDDEVWRWSEGQFFLQVLGTERFARDDPAVFVAAWDQRDASNKEVPPGGYEVRGELACDPPVRTPPVAIEIHPAEEP